MDKISCTEDRIRHALQRCLSGLNPEDPYELGDAGLCINHWCLEELLRREVKNFLILLQQILRKTEEVLECCQYELVAPLTLLFSSTLLNTPHWLPEDSLLQKAYMLFHRFLSWPEPCSSASKHLLQVISQELRAPGISFQRLVRKEQGVTTGKYGSKTITVLCMSTSVDCPPELQVVSDQLRQLQLPQRDASIRLISRAFLAALGHGYPLHALRTALQTKEAGELEEVLTAVTDSMEMAAASLADPESARRGLRQRLDRLGCGLGVASQAADGAERGELWSVVDNAAAPTTALPSTTLPSTTLPSTALPSTTSPSTALPSTTSPTTALPTTTLPSTTLPSTTLPSTTLPSTALPSTTSPSTALPTTALPSTTSPSTALPSMTSPSTTSPSTALPSTTSPSMALPSTTSPTTALPTTTSPSTALPTTTSPSTALPIMTSPSTALPSTTSPSTTSPSTALPSTTSPSTALPTTTSPSTALPSAVDGDVSFLELPFAKCHVCPWEEDNFDNLCSILEKELHPDLAPDCFHKPDLREDGDEEGTEEEEENHSASSSSRDSMLSCSPPSSSWSLPLSWSCSVDSDAGEDTRPRRKPKKKSRSLLNVERLSLVFRAPRSPSLCRRVQSMGYRGDLVGGLAVNGARLKRSTSLPRRSPHPPAPKRPVCIHRRPILSVEDGEAAEPSALVRVLVLGGDRELGRLARAYSDLQQKERKCPRITRKCKLQFFFVPAKNTTLEGPGERMSLSEGQTGSHFKATPSLENSDAVMEVSTDIAHLLALLDPWYKRSVLSLLTMSSQVVYHQTTCKADDVTEGSRSHADRLLADLLLYYCRHARQPALLQLYQAELTLAGGGRIREVFIYSLELGHTAGTRAVRAMGAASKRFGIDGDREAVPLNLAVGYNKISVGRRGQWIEAEVACTSVNLHKACRREELIDLGVESLQLTVTEVLKRQSTKAKMGYNQHICVSEVKVDSVRVVGGDGMTFAVCLDQDEKRILQGVVRCEVSLCCKPGSNSDWWSYKPLPGQVRPLDPTYCSLLCLPINSFTASNQ